MQLICVSACFFTEICKKIHALKISGVCGIWTQNLQIGNPTPYPLLHGNIWKQELSECCLDILNLIIQIISNNSWTGVLFTNVVTNSLIMVRFQPNNLQNVQNFKGFKVQMFKNALMAGKGVPLGAAHILSILRPNFFDFVLHMLAILLCRN